MFHLLSKELHEEEATLLHSHITKSSCLQFNCPGSFYSIHNFQFFTKNLTCTLHCNNFFSCFLFTQQFTVTQLLFRFIIKFVICVFCKRSNFNGRMMSVNDTKMYTEIMQPTNSVLNQNTNVCVIMNTYRYR